jgi:1-phosphofructokinase family hexose kinase
MILTLTPNPSIDHVLIVPRFRLGDKVRAGSDTRTPSGKGVAGSLVIRELGGETVALGFAAGRTGDWLAAVLDDAGVAHDLVTADGETRLATVLVDEAAGQQSTISAATLHATPAHVAQLQATVDAYAADAWGIICAGSLPPGIPSGSYATLLRHAREKGLITLLDTSGDALREGVAGLPHVLKINESELAALDDDLAQTAADPDAIPALLAALRGHIGAWASDAIVITLGERGSAAVTPEGSFHVRPPQVTVRNTAGAGDSFNAALMLARSRGATWADALRWGTAAAASVVMHDGTGVCVRAEVEELVGRVSMHGAPQASED